MAVGRSDRGSSQYLGAANIGESWPPAALTVLCCIFVFLSGHITFSAVLDRAPTPRNVTNRGLMLHSGPLLGCPWGAGVLASQLVLGQQFPCGGPRNRGGGGTPMGRGQQTGRGQGEVGGTRAWGPVPLPWPPGGRWAGAGRCQGDARPAAVSRPARPAPRVSSPRVCSRRHVGAAASRAPRRGPEAA